MWDQYFLEKNADIPGMPDFQESFNAAVFITIKLFGHEWLEATKSWSTLSGMTNIRPDRANQVLLDRHLATARGLMEAYIKRVRVHEVVECAVLLDLVVFWQLMSTLHQEYYTGCVAKFALWLVNTFATTMQADQYPGVLGCKLLYRMAKRSMQLGQAPDPVQFDQAETWFRRNRVPELVMVFQGFSAEGDEYIRGILRRVPLAEAGSRAEAGPLGKRAREPSPEGPARAAPAARGEGGSA